MNASRTVIVVLPSLKVSGGTIEALRLAQDLRAAGQPSRALTLWLSPHPVQDVGVPHSSLSQWMTRASRAPLQLPTLIWRFWQHVRKSTTREKQVWIFTHYATLPLAWCVPANSRSVFVQDLEWMFIAPGLWQTLLRSFILATYRRCELISANAYLTGELRQLGMPRVRECPIWADPAFLHPNPPDWALRDIDMVMVLRKGTHKRLDLYRALLPILRQQQPGWKLAVITPEDDIAKEFRPLVDLCLIRPTRDEMRALYARSRIFLLLSEHEGFGLPPLEAMGAGCIPVCRDCGGVRAYMTGPWQNMLIPLALSPTELVLKLTSIAAHLAESPCPASDAAAQFKSGATARATIQNTLFFEAEPA